MSFWTVVGLVFVVVVILWCLPRVREFVARTADDIQDFVDDLL